jgi:predicted DNA binding CopG/RHH family protein
MSKLKKLPNFKTEAEERKFWATHSALDYFDWDNALVNPSLPNLKPSTEVISLRLPQSLLEDIKVQAHMRDLPYQSLLKVLLDQAVTRLKQNAIL